jgi:hypothetical protein
MAKSFSRENANIFAASRTTSARRTTKTVEIAVQQKDIMLATCCFYGNNFSVMTLTHQPEDLHHLVSDDGGISLDRRLFS